MPLRCRRRRRCSSSYSIRLSRSTISRWRSLALAKIDVPRIAAFDPVRLRDRFVEESDRTEGCGPWRDPPRRFRPRSRTGRPLCAATRRRVRTEIRRSGRCRRHLAAEIRMEARRRVDERDAAAMRGRPARSTRRGSTSCPSGRAAADEGAARRARSGRDDSRVDCWSSTATTNPAKRAERMGHRMQGSKGRAAHSSQNAEKLKRSRSQSSVGAAAVVIKSTRATRQERSAVIQMIVCKRREPGVLIE